MHSPVGLMPPHNLEAEEWTLGALMHAKRLAGELFGMLTAADFYNEGNALIFSGMAALHAQGKPITATLLHEQMGTALDMAGGMGRLLEIAAALPLAGQAIHYAALVAEKGRLRRLIHAGATMMEAAFEEGASAEAVHADALARLAGIEPAAPGSDDGEPGKLGAWYYAQLSDRYERSRQSAYHLESGWHDLDTALTVARGNLVTLAGRPGMSKTGFALQYAWNVAQGSPVLFYSLEMERDRLLDRLTLSLTTVEGKRLERGTLTDTDFLQARDVVTALDSSGLHLHAAPELTVAAVRTQAMRMAGKGRAPVLIVIDYLDMMRLGRADRHDLAIGQVTRGLKVLAGELGCAVMLLSQLSRKVEERPDKRPMLSDLKNSGSIEADSDIVMFLYRDDYYAALEKRDSKRPGVCDVIIAKYRNGQTRDVALTFDPSRQRYGCPEYGAPSWDEGRA